MNNYISRYEAGDTHFARTDKFTGAEFKEDEGMILVYIASFVIGLIMLAGLCLVATL